MKCDAFEIKVADAIHQDQLLVDDIPVVVGLSGGADSVALLAVLCHLGYKCKAVHCNFHLRGDEALRDQMHAVNVASDLGVSCDVVEFDTRSYMQQHGVSLEMACRELRYAKFQELMSSYGAQAIAVAHHRDDNVETLFLNLLRGTGIRGLRGMLPKQGSIVRPMLGVSRLEIEQYLSKRGLTYVVDSTNAINDTARNRLRNVVLPVLMQEFPDAYRAISSTMEILRSNEYIYHSAIAKLANEYVSCDGTRIAINRIVSEQRESLTILFELLRDFGFNVDQVAEMIHSYNTSGRRFYSKGYEALINRGLLLISHLSDGDSLKVNTVITDILNVTSWPIDCDVSIITPEDFAPNKGSVDVLFLDAEALLDDPIWMVRNWKNGDRIKPFGMKGSRKLSDIFSDAKLSVLEKQKVRVLTRNDEIIWIIGMRASRLFQVTSDTERILKIVLHNSEYLNT